MIRQVRMKTLQNYTISKFKEKLQQPKKVGIHVLWFLIFNKACLFCPKFWLLFSQVLQEEWACRGNTGHCAGFDLDRKILSGTKASVYLSSPCISPKLTESGSKHRAAISGSCWINLAKHMLHEKTNQAHSSVFFVFKKSNHTRKKFPARAQKIEGKK